MKKIISILLSFVTLMSISVTAFASDNSIIQSSDFYVLSEDVPSEVVSHLENSIVGITNDLYNSNSIEASSPFKVFNSTYDLYYSIIYSNGEIIGTYRIYKSGDSYTGIFRPCLKNKSCTRNQVMRSYEHETI